MSKNLVINIFDGQENSDFRVLTFNLSTGKYLKNCSPDVKNLLDFFDEPPPFVKTSVKAVVYAYFEKLTIEFCEKLAAKLKNIQIPFRFMPLFYFATMSQLIAAKINPEVDNEILKICEKQDIFRFLTFSRTENGYLLKKVREIPKKKFSTEAILDSTNPTKIIITLNFSCPEAVALKSFLSAWNPIILPELAEFFLFRTLKETVDHIFGLESSKKYFIIPKSDQFGIAPVESYTNESEVFFSTNTDDYLPLKKSIIVTRFDKQFLLIKRLDKQILQKVVQKPHEITKEGHRIKLTLSIDINNLPTLNHEGVLLSRVKNMPKKLKVEKTEKLPIIGFFDYASVICLWNEENNCYEFLDSWNGKFGKDLFLDLMFPKPKFVNSSTKVTSLSAAVYDLIKIMSMPPDDIKVDPKWKFNFTKDEDHPVLLEFDTYENDRKHATPAFLMALFLNEHIRAIKKETGIKPTKLGFRLLDEFENAEARKRVEAGLKEACGLIKIEC
uniref:Uncharacterized protein n=1 Tax=Panagrolaimus sp. ES5 TaxID=591445 RepID=A0AC34GZQ1_9BILA